MWWGHSSKTNLLGSSALHWMAFSCPRVPVLHGTSWWQWSLLPLLLHSAGRQGPHPCSCPCVHSSFPSCTPLGRGEHPVHLLLMNYTEGRSRYISSLSIIQRMWFFFFFLQWDSISRDGIFPSQKLKGISIVSHLPGGFKEAKCPVSMAKGLPGCPLSPFAAPCLGSLGNSHFHLLCDFLISCLPASRDGLPPLSSGSSIRKKTGDHNNGLTAIIMLFIECSQILDMDYLAHLILKTCNRYFSSSQLQIRKLGLSRD